MPKKEVMVYSDIRIVVLKNGVKLDGISNDLMDGVRAVIKKWGDKLLIVIDDFGIHFIINDKIEKFTELSESEDDDGDEVITNDKHWKDSTDIYR